MVVALKFNIGDTIYYMSGEIPTKGIISGITFFVGKKVTTTGERHQSMSVNNPIIDYHLEETTSPVHERDAYATKDELKKSVFEDLE